MSPDRFSFHNWDLFIGQKRDTIVLNNVNDNVDDDNNDELAYCNLLIASTLLVIAATPDEYR